MCSQTKSSSSYKPSLLMSSYRSFTVGASILFGAIILVVLANVMNINNSVLISITIVIALFGLGLLLYGALKGILSAPVTLYRVLRYQEYEEVTEPPELTEAAKKTRFLKLEKEWIALQAKRAGELER